MTELAASGVPVMVRCRVLKLSRQPYYRWLKAPVTGAEIVEAYRADALFDAHRDDPEFGQRLLADEAGGGGEPMSDRTAWKIMSENGKQDVLPSTTTTALSQTKAAESGTCSPPTQTSLVGAFDPDRVRDHHEHDRRTGCVTRTAT